MGAFRTTYGGLLYSLLNTLHVEVNARTGAGIRALEPRSFTVDVSDGRVPVCGVRRTYPKTAAAEVAWFLSGSKDVSFIRKYAPIWDKFVEDDGLTVAGAYGHRWREHFGRDQIGLALAELRRDPTSRRVWISAWDPATDGLGQPSKNVPCPVGFTLSVQGGVLNSALFIRSSDVFVGLPYDVMGHALLMDACARTLRVELGVMHVTLAHPHLYEVHRDMAYEALASDPSDDTQPMPGWSVDDIVNAPDLYVMSVGAASSLVKRRPEYACKPMLVI